MRILRSRLMAIAGAEEPGTQPGAKVSSRYRREGEKVRTYNFPQNRVTDHRIGYTSHRLAEFMDGKIDETMDSSRR